MDFHVTQRTRSLLQTRVRRVKAAEYEQYVEQVKFFIQFLNGNAVFKGAVEQLVRRAAVFEEAVIKSASAGQGMDFATETDHIASAYYVLKWLATANAQQGRGAVVAASHFAGANASKLSEMISGINDYLLEPLYEFLDESVDNRNSTLLLLQKYKQRCEWFWRNRLLSIANDRAVYGKDGERGLMLDMYEYLHAQGLDLSIEPKSASGEVDLISDQVGEEKVVLDGKFIKRDEADSTIRKKIVSGFRQVYDYCCDYGVSLGYLVIFRDSSKSIGIPSSRTDGFEYVELNGKHIYFLVIDVHEYETSASKRGQLEVLSITREELVQDLSADQARAKPQP